MTRMVFCAKLKKEAEGLQFAPLPGPLGQKVYENISKEAWDEWIKLQTMMVNEYQLNLADINARKHCFGGKAGFNKPFARQFFY